jgi:hypothetical protein
MDFVNLAFPVMINFHNYDIVLVLFHALLTQSIGHILMSDFHDLQSSFFLAAR